MLTESLVEAFRSRLEALGFDLADLRIGGTPNRPLVQVRIDCPPRQVTVEDCSRVSRSLEQWLDAEGPMANTTDVVTAIRELTNTKQLERSELIDLLKDGLHAALVKRYGPNVRAEIGIDEMKGSIRIVVLKTVVEAVEDPGTQISLEEA